MRLPSRRRGHITGGWESQFPFRGRAATPPESDPGAGGRWSKRRQEACLHGSEGWFVHGAAWGESADAKTREVCFPQLTRCRGPVLLPTRHLAAEDRPHPARKSVAIAARPSHDLPHRPCPPHARSVGFGKVAYGQQRLPRTPRELGRRPTTSLRTAARTRLPARDRWGHTGATSGPRMTRSQRTTPVTSGSASSQLNSSSRPASQVVG